jgi:DNA helicase-2/ATP-dependent DNA helicase PcrA
VAVDLSHLNPAQREAVEATEGPVLVLAGAGSGKTRVLTHRIAHIIDQGLAKPGEILAITFTNRASAEMKERLTDLLGYEPYTWVMTFHAACGRILRKEAERIGFRPNFTIYDQDDAVRMVRNVMKELGFDTEKTSPKHVHSEISAAKNRLQGPAALGHLMGDTLEGQLHARVYALYQERLAGANAVDFDDMLMLAVAVLEKYPDAKSYWQERFKYVLVDEYQDTNIAQAQLLKLLGEKHTNVFTVGDANQSIYAFRMADIRNIIEFDRAFPNARVITLEQNYRSVNSILRVANNVILNNREQGPKTVSLWSDLGEGEAVRVLRVGDEREEARYVIQDLQSFLDEGNNYSEAAVLYRTNAQSRAIEQAFQENGIPYRIVGGPRFYDRAEVKDAMAYMKSLDNLADQVSITRATQTPKRGLGLASLDKLARFAREQKIPFGIALARADEAGVGGKAKASAEKFYGMMGRLAQEKEGAVARLMEKVLSDSGYIAALEAEGTHEARGRLENLEELIGVARQFDAQGGSLSDFLQEVALWSEQDKLIEENNAVTMMTLHNAKGLEFGAVYLVGLEEGLLPHNLSIKEGDVEEERRLFYVGITRAKERLSVTYAAQRFLFGEVRHALPSRFLPEMQGLVATPYSTPDVDDLLDHQAPSYGSGTPRIKPARKRQGPALSSGDAVRHPKFGEGIVVSLNGDDTVTIVFRHGGERRLMLEYAPLTKI